MKIKILIAMLCLMSTNWAVAVAASETDRTGDCSHLFGAWEPGTSLWKKEIHLQWFIKNRISSTISLPPS